MKYGDYGIGLLNLKLMYYFSWKTFLSERNQFIFLNMIYIVVNINFIIGVLINVLTFATKKKLFEIWENSKSL